MQGRDAEDTGTAAVFSANAARMLEIAATRHASQAAIIDTSSGDTMSYSRLWRQARAIAGQVRAAELRPGDRVAIFLERGAASAAAYFGVLAAGGVAVIVHESLKARQIDYIVRHAGARLLLSAGPHLARARAAAPPEVTILDIGTIEPDASALDELVARTGADMAHIIYTSGSTGMPKGVVVSHANVWAGMAAVVEYLGIGGRDRIASLLPLSFDYGLNQLLCAVGTGATLIVERTPVAQRIVASLYDHGVSVLPAVPPLWLQLLNVERFRHEPLDSLRVMTNTGGRLPTTAVRALRRSHPDAKLVLMYGLTEAFRSTYLSPERADEKPESMGRAIPGAEILVVRDDLSPCEVGEVGQLVHRGPTVTLGYWNDPEATRERFGPHPLRPPGTPDAERVVFSGDLVRMDEDGDLFFVGRRDAMIKSMGHRVAPDEITEPLYASGEIVEVVITTEPDAMRGDAIVAHVVLREGGSLERLERYAARELPRYMQPQRYEAHAELARTTSGKHDGRAVSEVPR
jgi:amino acid adenylation domain-containing protein